MVAAEVKVTLNAVYPDEHRVRLVHAAGTKDELVKRTCQLLPDRPFRTHRPADGCCWTFTIG